MPTESLACKQLSQHQFLATSDPFAFYWGSHLQAALFFYTVFVVTIILCLWYNFRYKYSCWFIVALAEHFGIICERSMWDIHYFLYDDNILLMLGGWVYHFYPQSELGSFWHVTGCCQRLPPWTSTLIWGKDSAQRWYKSQAGSKYWGPSRIWLWFKAKSTGYYITLPKQWCH